MKIVDKVASLNSKHVLTLLVFAHHLKGPRKSWLILYCYLRDVEVTSPRKEGRGVLPDKRILHKYLLKGTFVECLDI